MSERFIHRLRVRYGECDPQGVVFNANYLAYFDVAMTELWREAIGPWEGMAQRGIDMVVAEANVRYRAGARFDECVRIETWVERLGTTSVTSRYDVLLEDDTLAVEGTLRHVVVALGTNEKRPLPDDIRAALERYAADPAEAAV